MGESFAISLTLRWAWRLPAPSRPAILHTIELKINFFRPVWEARLRAEGKVVRRGSTIGYMECEITE